MKVLRAQVLALVIALGCAVSLWSVSASTESSLSNFTKLSAVTRSEPTSYKHFSVDFDRQITLGSLELIPGLRAASSTPTALASADFDEDGVQDLVSGYSTEYGGALLLQRGNIDAIYPNSRQAKLRKATQQFTNSPFLPDTTQFSAPTSPEFIAAGDFDANGHRDLLLCSYETNSLYLMSGTGRGGFQPAREVSLAGRITAIAGGEIGGPDGLADIAVAITTEKGSRLLVYQHPEGAFRREPEVFNLSFKATAIALGNFDEDPVADVAVAGGSELVFIHGHQQIYPWDMIAEAGVSRPPAEIGRRSFPFEISALAAGRFGSGTVDSLALLSSDGAIHLLEAPPPKASKKHLLPDGTPRARNLPASGNFNLYKKPETNGQLSAEELKRRGYATFDSTKGRVPNHEELVSQFESTAKSTLPSGKKAPIKLDHSFFTAPSRIRQWNESSWPTGFRVAAASSTTRKALTRARVSTSLFDDLMVTDLVGQQVYVLNRDTALAAGTHKLALGEWQSPGVATLAVAGGPIAILPLRLNSDALSDLAILRNGSVTPTTMTTEAQNTYVVNTTDDSSNTCSSGGPCTLRGAITAANLNPGSDTIVFDIPGDGVHEIDVVNELPSITDSVTIDATTQPGYDGSPLIEVSGGSLGPGDVDGLKVRASDCVIRGLAIGLFPHFSDPNGSFIGGNGLTLETLANQTRHVNSIIEANYLGTNANGTLDQGNASTGLIIFDADNNTIGGTVPEARNVISGNGNDEEAGVGIEVVNGMQNKFQGNFIGADSSGSAKLGNSAGVDLTGFLNAVGGDEPGAGNTISGNGEPDPLFPELHLCRGTGLGVAILTTADGDTLLTQFNMIKGNLIGTDYTGTLPLGNCSFGVSTTPVTQTVIGSIAQSGRNVISDNGLYGVNCSYTLSGVVLPGGFCVVSGNNIGTDITGTAAMRNDGRNTRPGLNPGFGVLTVSAESGATASVGAPGGTTPGGPCTGFCNLISGNDALSGSFQGDAVDSTGSGLNGLFNNYIGTNVNGTTALPNYFGAFLNGNSYLGSVGFVLGPPSDLTPLGNLISGNTCGGASVLAFSGFGDEVLSAYARNNLIGTDVTGNNSIPNTTDSGCANPGLNIAADSLSTVLVGGTEKPGQRNIISGNAFNGLHVQGHAILQNNYVGVAQNGTPMGNAGNGITVLPIGGDRPNLIGGAGQGEANIIGNNGGAGIFLQRLFPDQTTITDIRANSIFNNGGLGIDLFPLGVNANDASDPDVGPNDLQNYPSLDAPVFNTNGTVTVRAWLNSQPNSSYRVDFYSSSAPDPTKYGEGQTFIGDKVVSTNASGRAEFTFTSSAAVTSAQKITATATNSSGNTSEFSCVAGQCVADVGVTIDDNPDPVAAGTTLTYTLQVTNSGPATATNVMVTDKLHSTVNFGSATPSQGSCVRSGVTITCNLGSLNVGANATITIQVTPTTEGEISNTASATRSEEDPVPENDTDTERTQVGPAIIIVTTSGDESDSDPGDSICDVDPNTTGSQCTLRAALELANSRAGRDAIKFDIPGGPNHTISPQSALPTISQSVSLDATTQPGFEGLPVIVLNGAGANSDAFKIIAGNSYLAGFAIIRFSGSGIVIQGGPGGNIVEGNIIGTDANGTPNIGLGGDGIVVDNSPNNQIGRGNDAIASLRFAGSQRLGFLNGLSNVIGSCNSGVKIVGLGSVLNKVVGVLSGGILKGGTLTRLPNLNGLSLVNAVQTLIGGFTPQESCTFVANTGAGIKIEQGSFTKLLGSFVGTTKAGDLGLGNLGAGIQIEGSSQNQIGGNNSGASNVISGNQGPGVLLKGLPNSPATLNNLFKNVFGARPDLSAGLGNGGSNIQVDGAAETTIDANTIVGSQTGCGVLLQDTQGLLPARLKGKNHTEAFFGALLTGNKVGLLDALGLPPLANLLGGICLENFLGAQIGAAGAGNIIAGNSGPGISLFGAGTKSFKLLGNLIGTDKSGTAGLGNQEGILIQGAQDGDIGGMNEGEGNIISGNSREAFKALSTNLQNLSMSFRVFNNLMGVKPDGFSPLANIKDNIKLDGVTDVTVQGNTIGSSQTGCGVQILDTQQLVPAIVGRQKKAERNRAQIFGLVKIFGNGIGASKLVSGIAPAIGNLLGGICVEQMIGVQIGGPGILGNLIAGNANGPGILLRGLNTRGFGVFGNVIGTNRDGLTSLGNLQGIVVEGAQDGDIGGMNEGEGNVISGNKEEGLKAIPSFLGSPQFVSQLRILANRFGVKPNSTAPLGNGKDAIMMDGASQVTISSNTLVGSQNGCGLLLKDLQQRFQQITESMATITLNKIGAVETDPVPRSAKGMHQEFFALGNVLGGICIDNVPRLQIGDTNAGNVIAGNGGPGVLLAGIRTQLVQLIGNFIGTTPEGSPLGNLAGILVQGAKNNTIGGTTPGSGNTIVFNQEGIVIKDDNGVAAELNRIFGNLIGMIRDLSNVLRQGPNSINGIRISDSTNNEIGQPGVSGARNIISANSGPGVVITGPNATFNKLFNNYIGTDDTGLQPFGNASHGVLINNGARLNTVGGPASGAANTIAFNVGAGVAVDEGAGHCNNLDPNSIFGNSGAGIDLGASGPTANDPEDGDSGANNLQNFPEITRAVIDNAGNLTLTFKVDSAPGNSDYGAQGLLVEFFKADASLSGQTFIGDDHYAAADYDSSGGNIPGLKQKNFGSASALGVQVGDHIVALATDNLGNTSEFTSTNVGIVVGAPTAATGVVDGRVTTNDGVPLSGVTVNLQGTQARVGITDSDGRYQFREVETNGFYTLTPSRVNYSFTPANRSFSLLASRTEAVFTAAAQTEAANPLDGGEFFVRQQYLDFLNREPEEGGLGYWSSQLHNCGPDPVCVHSRRIGVAAAFFIESEFQQTGSFIYRVYKASLGRQPGYSEFLADRRLLSAGNDLAERQRLFASEWVRRPNFVASYPDNLSAAEFVNRLYDSARLLPYESQRQQQIEEMMNSGKTRARVLADVIETAEFKQGEYNPTFVLMEYFGYLNREPDREGYDYWLNILNNRERDNYRSMVCAFITSSEYQRRFSSVVTRTNADCGQ